jgi:hypothetical protein
MPENAPPPAPPGPNVLIVTLIGYHVAGIVDAMAATVAMGGPTVLLAYDVSGFLAGSSHALAHHHSTGPRSLFDRPDGRQRPDFGANFRL